MAILILGVTGFVGSSLVDVLLSKGHRVVGVGRKGKGFLKETVVKNSNFILIQSDILKINIDELKKYGIKFIYNTASLQPFSGALTFDDMYEGNVKLIQQIIFFAKELQVEGVVHVSTSSVYGEIKPRTLDEMISPNPISYYGLAKYLSEKILELDLKNTNINSYIIRFPSIFGKNHLGGIIYTLYQSALLNDPIELYSNGKKYRSLIYIDSAVEMLCNVFEKQKVLKNFELFIAGSSDSLQLKTIAELIIQLTNSNSELILIDKQPPSDFDVFIDSSKAKEILSFMPLSIEDGLNRYVKAMRDETI